MFFVLANSDSSRGCANIWRKFLSINLFYHRHKSSAATLITEKRATRLYLLLLFGTLAVLICYNALAINNVKITLQNPSQADFERLKNSFGRSLQCPCQQIAFELASFVEVNVRFHQICTSVFIEPQWIMVMWGDGNWSNIASDDFLKATLMYFTSLQTFCGMAMRRLADTTKLIREAFLISAELITQADLISRIELQTGLEIDVSLNNFRSQIELATGMMQLNQILNIYSSNWIFLPVSPSNVPYSRITTRPVVYGQNCSCATSLECTQPVFLDNQVVPGFLLACTPIEVLLRSTLICLYNATCFQMILNFQNISNYQPLDNTVKSRFSLNSPMKELVFDMFMEDWSVNISYASYFDQCQPKSCSYVILEGPDFISVISIILGLYSGLRVILRLLSPLMIHAATRISGYLLAYRNMTK